ncbi:hypothetical protein AAFF_G00394810 [Aldrovandia affinis]|uniref:Uncharacterized protein n=1 Tax=Aldrovandia affinis TaxID=143900 RepID=A0AAD7SDT9_9TELE|nr:hypothetical protein AAFF_G00394810 [Aldrovandia affinis]
MLSAQVGAEHSIPSTPSPTGGSSSHKTPLPPEQPQPVLWSASITNTDGIITGAKLPSGRQILRCMLYNRDTQLDAKRPGSIGALRRFEAAKVVLEQRSCKVATFGTFNAKLQSKVKRRQEHEAGAAARQARTTKEQKEMTATSSTAVLESESDEDSDTDEAAAPPAENTPCTHERKRTGTTAFIPPDILSRPSLASLATRLKITPMQQATFTREPDHGVSTLMQTLSNGSQLEERLTVVVGYVARLKLLSVPAYTKGTDEACGAIIARLTCKLLQEWLCANQVVNMAFDTTASNTGHLTAACIAIQLSLGRPLLCAAQKVTFQRLGALHKAQWMAKLLYTLKLALMEQHITFPPQDTITTRQQVLKIRVFADFITHMYATWWLTCDTAIEAAWNYLTLYHRLYKSL